MTTYVLPESFVNELIQELSTAECCPLSTVITGNCSNSCEDCIRRMFLRYKKEE